MTEPGTKPGPPAPPPTLRLFIALYPPADVAARMSEFTAGLSRARVRRVPAGQIHMTLLFLGDRPGAELDAIIAKIGAAAAGIGPITLAPHRVFTLPQRPPARVVAHESDASPNIHELYKRLVAAFPTLGDRPAHPTLLPHFTLARFRPNSNGPVMSSPAHLPPMKVGELRLVQSVLGPRGPTHSVLATVPLETVA
ncbi:MAG TPA: RNA 2',3'-cyclic phosphodiesterase [Phycisphaerales bacterium]|nr:RNA 2',3'-cyclic phosphodiesterase [Phycisphaerales bacterium]